MDIINGYYLKLWDYRYLFRERVCLEKSIGFRIIFWIILTLIGLVVREYFYFEIDDFCNRME